MCTSTANSSERIVPSLAEINFLGRKLERAVAARARTQRSGLCFKARAPDTLVGAQPPPPPAFTTGSERTPHGPGPWSAMRGTGAALAQHRCGAAHGGPDPWF